MNKPDIAIIGASLFQDPLILKAKELGYKTHVFAWAADDIGEKHADHFYPISITEKEEIYKKCMEIGVRCVVSIGSDLAVHTVNYIQRKLGLPCNSERCDLTATNKYLMRQAFMQAGVPCPKFIKVGKIPEEIDLAGMTYPLIVKPTDRSGSRGITKVENYDDVCKAVPESAELSFEKSAIIEEFIEGNEYSCECISFEGKHSFLAFTKKYTTGAPHFIETGHMEPSDIPEDLHENFKEQIFKALDALDIRYGASHTEFRITPDGQIRIIEIGPRMGGDFIGSDLVYLSTGYDFLKMVIDAAQGIEPAVVSEHSPAAARVFFLTDIESVEKYNETKKLYPETIFREGDTDGNFNFNFTDSGSRHGYYITVNKG